MSEFSDSDYRGLLVNVHEKKGKDLLKEYPDLKLYQEFSQPLLPPLDINEIITYIVLTYDRESPFRKKYPDLNQRKYHSAIEAGFELNDKNKFDAYIEEILQCQNPIITDMIVAYCRMHYNTKYSFLVLCESLFYTNLKNALSGETVASKMTELKQMQDAMETAQRELLAFDNNPELIKTLYKAVNNQRIDFSPEVIAHKIKEGKVAEHLDDKEF